MSEKISSKKIGVMLGVGTGLEYYDFIIYGLLSSYISQTFFPNDVVWLASLNTFLVFALGYLARPFGAVIFGLFSDLISPSKTLIFTMFIMGISSLLIALLPGFDSIGIAAPILLCLLRVLQGMAVGAEIPNSLSYLDNQSTSGTRAKDFAPIGLSLAIAALIAGVCVFITELFFSHAQMEAGGWRLPFVIGGLIAFFSIYIRGKIPHADSKSVNIKEYFDDIKSNIKNILLLLSAILVVGAMIMEIYFVIGYSKNVLQLSSEIINIYFNIGNLTVFFLIYFMAKYVDLIGRRKFLIIMYVVIIIVQVPLLNILQTTNVHVVGLFVILQYIINGLVTVAYLPFVSEFFNVERKTVLIGVTYSLLATIVSFIPSICIYLQNFYGFISLYVLFVGIAIFSLIAILFCKIEK